MYPCQIRLDGHFGHQSDSIAPMFVDLVALLKDLHDDPCVIVRSTSGCAMNVEDRCGLMVYIDPGEQLWTNQYRSPLAAGLEDKYGERRFSSKIPE